MICTPEIIRDEVRDGVRHICARPCQMVCCSQIDIAVRDGVIEKVLFTSGCNGNTQGVAALACGMRVDDACSRILGIDCHGKGTSCPDQLARVLRYVLGR